MKNKLAKPVSALLALMMLFTCIPLTSFASGGHTITVSASAPATAETTAGTAYVLVLSTIFLTVKGSP